MSHPRHTPPALAPTGLMKPFRRLGLIVLVPLLLALLSLLVGSLVSISGLSLMRFAQWQAWQVHHYGYFLLARLLLFSLAAWGWVWFRRRALPVQPGVPNSLKRAEVIAALGILLIELVRALALWEGLA
ncbi:MULTISPECIES: hypothetical protein [Pseudomonas]|uniref:hypothetical protein n=1 Tax=Pseudomonas TaxID=286 RepID=UPI0023629513|nr:hypothetical protein [Pseudomonas asplenii]